MDGTCTARRGDARVCDHWLLAIGFAAIGLAMAALPVAAQGQTPSTPVPTPEVGDGDVVVQQPPGPRDPNNPITDSGGIGTGTTSDAARGSRRGLRDRDTSATDGTGDRGSRRRRGTDRDSGVGTDSTGSGTAQVDQIGDSGRSDRRSGGGAPTSVVGGGGSSGGGGGGGGVTMTKGQGAQVSVVGEGNFEPIFERELEYGEVPDEGLLIEFLSGPMTAGEFLATIHEATGWDIIASEAVQQITMNFWIVEKKPREALEILKFHDIYYRFDPDTSFLYVLNKDEYLDKEFGRPVYHEFTVEHADITYVESMLSSLVSAIGRIIVDQRTGRIYVWDTEENIEQMERTIVELDVPLTRREFTVEHADVADIEAVVAGMVSPNGSILADARTGTVIVWDSNVALNEIASAIDQLDVAVSSRTFELRSVNAEDVVESLEPLLSPRGLIQVDPRYNALVITDLPARLNKMGEIIDTLDRELETRTWVINYADLDFIADQIETLIPAEMGEIILNEDVHQLTITGLPSRLDQIEELIRTWDIKRKQVKIEAFLVEIGTDVAREFNINWSYLDNVGGQPIRLNVNEGFSGPTATSSNPVSVGQLPYAVPLYGALELRDGQIQRPVLRDVEGDTIIDRVVGNNVAVTLDYLDSQNKATVISLPLVTVQDGEEANFESVTQVPFISSTSIFNSGGFNSNINNTNRVEFIDVGTVLSVLPRVTEEANILLDILAEDSDFIDKEIVANDQVSTIPQKTVRQVETQVRVSSGDTIVLGGLRRDRTSRNVNRTPILGDIPVVGRLFRNQGNAARRNTLLIFITTTVVDDRTHPEAEMLADVSDHLADRLRHQEKNTWGRMGNRLARGTNEIGISVGQSGHLHSQGERVTISELRARFAALDAKAQVTVVIRKHPRAPQEVVTELTEAAMESGLKIVFDDFVPLVPDFVDPPLPEEVRMVPEAKLN